jgi:glycosyltransferase involved in cell wall biosynthesis
VATYQRAGYLPFALKSIADQTYRDIEVIVVDDGSTDHTKDVVADSAVPIRYIYQENSGAAAAKNRGVEAASGAFISFLDSDDIWHPEKLQSQQKVLDDNPATDLVFCHGKQFISKEIPAEQRDRLYCPEEAMPAPVSSALLVSRKIFDKVGPFDSQLQVGIDVDWYLRAKALNLRIEMMPQILLYRRIHPGNSGYLNKNQNKQHIQVVKAHLERMRKSGKSQQTEQHEGYGGN